MSMTNEQACELELAQARADIERLTRSNTLLVAAIADSSLSRVALQTVARALSDEPLKPNESVLEWAEKVARRVRGDQQTAEPSK